MSDNKWFKKEAPLQSLTGLWGGLASNLTSGSGGSAWTHGIEMWGGGGGAGGNAGADGVAGGTNLGGGGGAGGTDNSGGTSGNPGNGGSGVVIIRYKFQN